VRAQDAHAHQEQQYRQCKLQGLVCPGPHSVTQLLTTLTPTEPTELSAPIPTITTS
jgi:hypothetical protein